MVLHNKNSIPIFTYTWRSGLNLAEETMFSGMMQAITMITSESIQQGNLEEIQLSKAVLIFQTDAGSPLTFVLVTTHYSETLKILRDTGYTSLVYFNAGIWKEQYI